MSESEKRSIHIRIREDHYALIRRTARAVGQATATYIRTAAIEAAKAEQRREA